MRKAVVSIHTNLVVNIIKIDPDEDGNFDHWPCPVGYEIVPAVGPSPRCGIGWTWDGDAFIEPPMPEASRLDTLFNSRSFTVVDDVEVPKTAEALETEAVELQQLLRDKLESEGLSTVESQRLLLLSTR